MMNDSGYLSWCFDIQSNKALSKGDSRKVLERGFVTEESSKICLKVREEGTTQLSECIDARPLVNCLAASQKYINWTWFYLSAAALAVCAVAVSGAHVLRTRMVKRPGDDTWQTVAEASIEMDQLNKLPLISRLVLPESTSAPETPARAPEAVATNHDEKDLSHLIEELLLDSNGNPCPLRIGDMSDKDMDNAIRALERIDDHLQEQTWGKAAKAIREMVKAD